MAAKQEDTKKVSIVLVKNIRYNGISYKLGEKIDIKEDDLEEFKLAKAIKEE